MNHYEVFLLKKIFVLFSLFKKLVGVALSQTFHRNVWEGWFVRVCKKGRAHTSPTPPFGNPPPLKRWTKLLLLCLLCAARLFAFKCNVFFFRHHEPINHKSRYDPEDCSAEHICRKVNGKIQS